MDKMLRKIIAVCFIFGVMETGVAAEERAKRDCRGNCKIGIFKNYDRIVDLTHDINSTSRYWPSSQYGFSFLERISVNSNQPEEYYAFNNYRSPEHIGTHLDAPVHFQIGQRSVNQIPFSNLFGKGMLVNLQRNGQPMNRDDLITVDLLKQWESANGKIRRNRIVLLNTGYGEVYWNKTDYFGTNKTGAAAASDLRFPGLDGKAASWLVTKINILSVGIDTASIDAGSSKTFQTHRILAKHQIPNFENVANLNELIGESFYVIALPMKIQEGTGAPLRIVAILDQEGK